MYESNNGLGLSLPRWLTPPRVVRQAIGDIFGSVVRQTTIPVKTSTGTVVFTPVDPSAPPPGQGAVPGGWGTVGVVAALAAGALLFMRRGRR